MLADAVVAASTRSTSNGAYVAMRRAVRNIGRDGDRRVGRSPRWTTPLWDLKARLLDMSARRPARRASATPSRSTAVAASRRTDAELCRQLSGWVRRRHPFGEDEDRPRSAGRSRARARGARRDRRPTAALFVDANGAYDRKLALEQAAHFADAAGVRGSKSPCRRTISRACGCCATGPPPGMEIAAGEYGYDLQYFRRMLDAGSVDVLQADATRCGGITGFLRAGALADAFGLPLSAHTAPSVHAHLCCAVSRVRHLEYFHDHARIEQLLFDGVLRPIDGALRPDRSRPGNGLELKRAGRPAVSRLDQETDGDHDVSAQNRHPRPHIRLIPNGRCAVNAERLAADLAAVGARRGSVRPRQSRPLRHRRIQLPPAADRRGHSSRRRRRRSALWRCAAGMARRSSAAAAAPAWPANAATSRWSSTSRNT